MITLGFHEDHAIRLLTTSSATRDDKVFVLTGKPVVPAARRAFEGLRSYMLRVGIGEPELVEVPPNLAEGVEAVLKVFSHDVEYVLGLSGGMRYLIVFTLIALVLSGRSATIWIYPEGGEVPEVVVPKDVVASLRRLPTGAELRILKEVANSPGITDEEVAEKVGRKVKTVKNVVSELVKSGLVIRKGRKGGLYPTEWGLLIARYVTGEGLARLTEQGS